MKTSGYLEDENITLLAKGVELKGEFRVEGTVRIDGRLEGEIYTNGTVIIGGDGMVKGTINAGTLLCSGKIRATVTVSEKVQLTKSAILVGEVHAPAFLMEEGAKFHGHSDMDVSSWAEEIPNLLETGRELPRPRARRAALLETQS